MRTSAQVFQLSIFPFLLARVARAKGRLERASGCATVLEAMLPLLVTSRTLQTMFLVTLRTLVRTTLLLNIVRAAR